MAVLERYVTRLKRAIDDGVAHGVWSERKWGLCLISSTGGAR